jgi:prepilin-type N-terminal cleavage/methylation domain-containing protein
MAARRRVGANRTDSAYTVIELLVVIAIISVLAGMLLGGIMMVRGRGAQTKVRALVERLQAACLQYEGDYGEYPPGAGGVMSAEDLYGCLTSPRWRGMQDFGEDDVADTDENEKLEIVDHWKQPISYYHHRSYSGAPRATTFRIVSAGPDGEEGTADDITNFR